MRLHQKRELGDPLARRDRWALDLNFDRARMRLGKARSARVKGLPGLTSTGGAGFKYAQTAGGVWLPAAANEPGETDAGFGVWGTRTNSIRNPTALGAVVGPNPGAGVMPTNWLRAQVQPGLVLEIMGTGVEQGLAFCEFRLSGTTTSITQTLLQFETLTAVSAVAGETWTAQLEQKLVSGDAPATSIQFIGVKADGATLSADTTALGTALLSLVRAPVSASITLTDATTAFLKYWWRANFANGATVDSRFRVYAPNLKKGVNIGDPLLQQTSNLAATRTGERLLLPYIQPRAGWAFAEFIVPQFVVAGGSPRVLGVGSGANQFAALLNVSSAYSSVAQFNNLGPPTNLNVNIALTPGMRVKAVVTWDEGGRSITANGLPPASDANGVGSWQDILVGTGNSGNTELNSTVLAVAAGVGRLSPARMQGMTAL